MEKTTLSESTKEEVQKVMTMEYTSSDESNCETESDSEDSTRGIFLGTWSAELSGDQHLHQREARCPPLQHQAVTPLLLVGLHSPLVHLRQLKG